MSRYAGLVPAAVVAIAIWFAPAAPAADPGTAGARTICTFQDPRITESSGLVDLGSLLVTVNDSGDAARVYVVDPGSGRTVGTTYFHADVHDDEALAPAGPGRVWVGDIGGNLDPRRQVEVYRVPVRRGAVDVARPEHYTLRYPAGEHDAESLFADARGRLYVVTKAFTGGLVFRAPARLRPGRNRLEPVAQVPLLATDAALLPDGRHVVVRSLRQATVFRLPDFATVGSFSLPPQQQGEGISVGPGGRILLSSEGSDAPVLQIDLPADVVRRMRQGGITASATPRPSVEDIRREQAHPSRTWLAWAAAGVVLAAALGVGATLRRRG